MPNTITSFPTAVAGQKARASDFNTAFSNYRGDLIPINSNTATASDNSHDLGTSEHRWKDIYAMTLRLSSGTTTSDLIINPDATSTLGSFNFLCGTFTITTWKPDNISWHMQTATGAHNFFINGGNTICAFTNAGIILETAYKLYINNATANFIVENNGGKLNFRRGASTITSINNGGMQLASGAGLTLENGAGDALLENNATNFNLVLAGSTVGTFDTDGLQFYSLKTRQGGTASEGIGEVALSSNISASAQTATSTIISGSTITLACSQRHYNRVALIADSNGVGPYATVFDTTNYVSIEILRASGTTVAAATIQPNVSNIGALASIEAIDTQQTSSAQYYLKRSSADTSTASTIVGRLVAYEI